MCIVVNVGVACLRFTDYRALLNGIQSLQDEQRRVSTRIDDARDMGKEDDDIPDLLNLNRRLNHQIGSLLGAKARIDEAEQAAKAWEASANLFMYGDGI